MMSKMHYETFAAWIRESESAGHVKTRARLAAEMATMLAADNPRFDRVRFLTACQPRWIAGTRAQATWNRETS